VTAEDLTQVDRALLCISEARERTEQAARTMREADAEPSLVSAMEAADSELLAIHRRLMQSAYFGARAEQLKLSA
jgi:hypothetical protein